MNSNAMRRPEHRKPVNRASDAMKKIVKQDVQLNIRVAPEIKRELRKLAAEQDTTVTEIVTELIKRHLGSRQTI